MSVSRDDPRTSAWDAEQRLVDLLAEQGEQDEDRVDVRPLYPFRLVQGDDDLLTETCRDGGGWSAEELAMHLVQEEEP